MTALDTRDIYGAISALASSLDLTARYHLAADPTMRKSALDDARRAKELLDRAIVRATEGNR
jgi:hypothetical protein